jgi:hypothetical protein
MTITTSAPDKPTIVLVHGASTESASWDGVIARLLDDGCSAGLQPGHFLVDQADRVAASGGGRGGSSCARPRAPPGPVNQRLLVPKPHLISRNRLDVNPPLPGDWTIAYGIRAAPATEVGADAPGVVKSALT